jgi:hypothetical protein
MYEVPNMAVFCFFLISCFPLMLLGYCPSDFEMVPVVSSIIIIIIIIIITLLSLLLFLLKKTQLVNGVYFLTRIWSVLF